MRYVNGTHSSVEDLSWFHRIEDRSNNPMEAYNKFKNYHSKRTANGYVLTGKQKNSSSKHFFFIVSRHKNFPTKYLTRFFL